MAYLTRAVDVQDSAARWTGLVARPLEEGNQSAAVGTGSLETVDFHGQPPYAGWDAALLKRAALGVASEWTNRRASELLHETVQECSSAIVDRLS